MNVDLSLAVSKASPEAAPGKKTIIKNASNEHAAIDNKEFDQPSLLFQNEHPKSEKLTQETFNTNELSNDDIEAILLADEMIVKQDSTHPLLNPSLKFYSTLTQSSTIKEQGEAAVNKLTLLKEGMPVEVLSTLGEIVKGDSENRPTQAALVANDLLLNVGDEQVTNEQVTKAATATPLVNQLTHVELTELQRADLKFNFTSAGQLTDTSGVNNLKMSQGDFRTLELVSSRLNAAPTLVNTTNANTTDVNATNVNNKTVITENLNATKSEQLKQIVNTPQGVFNIESRELLTPKAPLFSAVTTNQEQAMNSFEWRAETLKGTQNEWGQRLLNVLGDKVSLQIGQQLQRAHIRLDPPHLGSIEISIDIDGDKTSVSLVTSNAQVREAISQTLEQLRQTLLQNGSVSVDLNLSDKQQEQHQKTQDEKIAENDSIIDATSQDTENKQSTSSDWLNRLV
ncbi:flagellar hook-length control protein FliK [Pseudoalteromonas sp. JB197]|uniref:flagellar hook-length control protein FliK n=1 Tax=Pseudoalteromonas sp. JB197 TaxID=1434839 RepID=UPI00097E82AF|nr:flagellar hook-length control protein FliK [Pseudoalteromonas sp. JB197]PCC12257.1 flagellar hook-length control protein FliK [Pseudoalteromonas sp. JB197]SJN48861.1 Flagellar hook-length control protein FliK [Pseudoalteromonas sp. JB197]